jgi:hypothetical protein
VRVRIWIETGGRLYAGPTRRQVDEASDEVPALQYSVARIATQGGTGGNLPVLRGYDGGQEKFVRVVMNGKKNTAMAAFKGILTEQEVLNIYQYLLSLKRS